MKKVSNDTNTCWNRVSTSSYIISTYHQLSCNFDWIGGLYQPIGARHQLPCNFKLPYMPKVHSIQHFIIKSFSEFLWDHWFIPQMKLTEYNSNHFQKTRRVHLSWYLRLYFNVALMTNNSNPCLNSYCLNTRSITRVI